MRPNSRGMIFIELLLALARALASKPHALSRALILINESELINESRMDQGMRTHLLRPYVVGNDMSSLDASCRATTHVILVLLQGERAPALNVVWIHFHSAI